MKKNILSITLTSIVMLTGFTVFSNSKIHSPLVAVNDSFKNDTFKVSGNCGMCKKTIEGAVKTLKGIKLAEWNRETKMMTVSYDQNQITLDEIKKKIASAGYDTDKFKATDEAYNGLPGCCQYERTEK